MFCAICLGEMKVGETIVKTNCGSKKPSAEEAKDLGETIVNKFGSIENSANIEESFAADESENVLK